MELFLGFIAVIFILCVGNIIAILHFHKHIDDRFKYQIILNKQYFSIVKDLIDGPQKSFMITKEDKCKFQLDRLIKEIDRAIETLENHET